MIDAKKVQIVRVLDQVLCICYSIQLQKDKNKDILALLNSGSKVNIINLAYLAQLGIKVQITNVSTQKIDGLSLETYKMVIAAF